MSVLYEDKFTNPQFHFFEKNCHLTNKIILFTFEICIRKLWSKTGIQKVTKVY